MNSMDRRSSRRTDPYRTTYHRDGTVTCWDLYTQTWQRTARPSDRLLATLAPTERARVLRHVTPPLPRRGGGVTPPA